MAQDITSLLAAAGQGDRKAADQLFQLVYVELRRIAKSQRHRWVGNQTLNTTALIHETYVRMQGQEQWASRTHFYATAAKAMRHVLINYAERRRAGKRGGGTPDLPLDDVLVASDGAVEDALSLHQALEQLEEAKPRWCRIVECRFFGGMNLQETAEALDVSVATVGREWRLASAWLYDVLHQDQDASSRAK